MAEVIVDIARSAETPVTVTQTISLAVMVPVTDTFEQDSDNDLQPKTGD